MNVVFIILDSLNRHFLPFYGNEWLKTPHLNRLASKSTIFDTHFVGSIPTIPARREMWTGNVEFLWRPWGSLEPWDISLPKVVKQTGIRSMLITDSYHLFEGGGQNYHIDFNGWEFIRGHEFDPWTTAPNDIKGYKEGRKLGQYARNMKRINQEREYCSPRTLSTVADWLEENHSAHDQFMLVVDEFDPHEPFDVPEHLWRQYDPDYAGPLYFWPESEEWEGPERRLQHLKARYSAKITMVDRYLGRVFERMDDCRLWDDTAVILTTDHGYFFGEHGYIGKPACPNYNTISHIPLLIYLPGIESQRINSLTSTVDLYPTILDILDVELPTSVDGTSLLPLIKGEKDQVREDTLYGYFGKWINYTDGQYTYFRGPGDTGVPLYVYSNRWNFGIKGDQSIVEGGRLEVTKMEVKDFRPAIDISVLRAPVSKRPEEICYEPHNHLYNLEEDPDQKDNLAGTNLEEKYATKLKMKMKELGAPEEQFDRVGL